MTLDLPGRSRRPTGPTTLSSLAHSGQVSIAAARSRLGLVAGALAIVVGSAIGSALALRAEPAAAGAPDMVVTGSPASTPSGAAAANSAAAASPVPAAPSPAAVVSPTSAVTNTAAAASPAPAAPASPTPAAPSPAVAPPSPEAHAALVAQIRDTLRRFVAWSHAHPGARCPDAAALGATLDPWGQPLRIVCSDQPPDQVAGVLSYGPDGEPGTRDDVVSWALGAGVTDLARGPRWSASRGMAPAAGPGGRHGVAHPGGSRTAPGPQPPPPPRLPASAGAGSSDTDGDGIPDRR